MLSQLELERSKVQLKYAQTIMKICMEINTQVHFYTLQNQSQKR